MKIPHRIGLATCVLALGATSAIAQNVKITPLGSHPGELCARDRATIFEDPTGVRILYDAGQSVQGGDDARLGAVHVVLLTHAHGDHIGDMRLKAPGAGTCENPEVTSAAPQSTTAEIVAAKNAAIVMVSPMAAFIGTKVAAIKGRPTPVCPTTGGDVIVPPAAPCNAAVQTGGTRTVRAGDASKAVEIITVTAAHDSAVPRELLGADARKALDADNVSLQLGPPIGYVIRFTNGLVLYLSGDTGMHAEMRSVVHDYHHANLMQLNLGATAISPKEAAYVVSDLVQPASVIASHVNEAGTVNGKPRAGSRTAAFVSLVKGTPVHPGLSGKTMEFNGEGKCVTGC